MTICAAEALPVLNLRALTDAQLADAAPNRALLDRRLTQDVLGMDERAYQAIRRLCAKWRAEPSVHGGKRRPADAGLVV